jgi:hypothetical protein
MSILNDYVVIIVEMKERRAGLTDKFPFWIKIDISYSSGVSLHNV